MAVKRGEVVWLEQGLQGSTLKKKRPAVVIQHDIVNRHAPHTIVAIIRADAGKNLPVQVPVPAGTAGLTKDSVVDCGYLGSPSQAAVTPTGSILSPHIMAQVNEALKRSLALP